MKKVDKKELHEIFNDLRNKSQTAYNKLYESYYSLVYGITFSILKNKEDCEDITQEIFTKIYKLDVDKLPTDNEASWLFTVSKNECFLYLRKLRPNISIDEIYEIPELSNDLEDIIDIEYYNNMISGLKEDDKLIVSLKVLSNFTFKKISQVMNIPIGTVQWKYYNAINSLKVSIGSLVGAIVAFVIVLAKGELWSKKEYLNKNSIEDSNKTTANENSNTDDSENSYEGNETDKSTSNNVVNDNVITSENTSKNPSDNLNGNTHFEENIDENTNFNDEKHNNLENSSMTVTDISTEENVKLQAFQGVFITLGIIFLIIFIISFKFFQQKLKKKASK